MEKVREAVSILNNALLGLQDEASNSASPRTETSRHVTSPPLSFSGRLGGVSTSMSNTTSRRALNIPENSQNRVLQEFR